MKTVSVFMDVEDPINPLADEAALELAQIFTDVGVPGSFCITGEKCRTLVSRGRADVINALSPHALGLHTDTHSFHPTTMELLADLPYQEGCDAAFESEKRGFDAFCGAFGKPPIFWGGAGNTWSPEITDAIKRLGVPAYSYALTTLPDQAVHRFNGVVALPQALSISETSWANTSHAAAESERVLQGIKDIGQPWIGIFVGHPTRFRYADFWDKPYWHGRTPPEAEYVELTSNADYEAAKNNLAAFLRLLKSRCRVIGVDEALELPWSYRPVSKEELDYFSLHTAAAISGAARWPVHKPGLSPDRITAKTLELSATLEVGERAKAATATQVED